MVGGGERKGRAAEGLHLAFSGGVKVTQLSKGSGLRSDLSEGPITVGVGTVLL